MALFETIARGDSERSRDAAYQWLQLLANKGDWDRIGDERDLWLAKIPEEQRATAYFYLGMIAFEQGRYYQTIADLQQALDKGIASPHDRCALEALLTSGREVNNLDICERSYALITQLYPEQKPEAGYVRARAYLQSGDRERALTLFEELIHQFPRHMVAEKASVEKVQLFMGEKKWEQAHAAVLDFLKRYSNASRKREMLRLAIDLSQMQASEDGLYTPLAEDLERAFAAHVFERAELAEKEELLAKTYLKLDRVHAALGILHEMEEADPLLFTLCYIKEGSSSEKVTRFGEKALEKYPDRDRLHLHLFNAYLKLAKADRDEELPNKELTMRAAKHLNAVIDFYPVSLENRLWLAHYFAKEQNERAIDLLESLLQTETNWKRFDEEGLMLARLYQKKDQLKKAQPLLMRVIALEQKTKPEAELILAEVYQELGEREKAEAIFAKLEEASELKIACAARLQLARLRFAQEPEKSLKRLHDLKVRKTLANEPIHLEAALDHADLQALLLPEKERLKSVLNALLAMKEEFTSDRDICSKDYHACRQLMPEKEQIYQAYMRYLDARIYLLQSRVARDPRERKAKENAARALFSTLRQGNYAVSKYLVEHATAGIYVQ